RSGTVRSAPVRAPIVLRCTRPGAARSGLTETGVSFSRFERSRLADQLQTVASFEVRHPGVVVDIRLTRGSGGRRWGSARGLAERLLEAGRIDDLQDARRLVARVPERVQHASRFVYVRSSPRADRGVADT